jgi:hypothetical protein
MRASSSEKAGRKGCGENPGEIRGESLPEFHSYQKTKWLIEIEIGARVETAHPSTPFPRGLPFFYPPLTPSYILFTSPETTC